MEGHSIYERPARALRVLLHPFAAPVYLAAVLFFGPTVLHNLPAGVRLYCLSIICLVALVIPLLAVSILRGMQFWQSLNTYGWERRVIPAALAFVCYIVCLQTLPPSISLFLLRKLVLAGAGCAMLAGIAGIFWSISTSMTAAGGALAILLLVDFAGFGDMALPFCAAALLAGATGSAGLYLEEESPWMMAAGFFGGFAVAAAAMLT